MKEANMEIVSIHGSNSQARDKHSLESEDAEWVGKARVGFLEEAQSKSLQR